MSKMSKITLCNTIWRVHIILVLMSNMSKVWNTMNNWSKAVYVKGVKDMSSIALYWRVYSSNYTVAPNTKSLNYNKIWLKALNYFKLDILQIT